MSRKDGLVLSMVGTEATFHILNVMEYSSARGRMSVIARAPDGSVRLFCKGADSKVLSILREGFDKSLMDAMQANLHLFATQVSSAADCELGLEYRNNAVGKACLCCLKSLRRQHRILLA